MLIFAYTVPAVFIAINATDNPLPQLALGSELSDGSGYLLDKLDKTLLDLGFSDYTSPFNDKSMHRCLRHHPRAHGGDRRPATCNRAFLCRAPGT